MVQCVAPATSFIKQTLKHSSACFFRLLYVVHEGNWREIQYLAASRREVLRCSAGDGWEEVARLFGLVVGLCEDNRELVGGVDDTTPSFTVSSRVNWHTQMVKEVHNKAKHQWAVQKANTQNSHKRQKGRNKVFFHMSSIQKKTF